MTTPSGLPLSALQYFPVARGAVANRVSTGDFYQALREAGATFGPGERALSFTDVNQLRSAAVSLRTAGERLNRAPDGSAITGDLIGVTPYARPQTERNALPIYHVGINLTTINNETGDEDTNYRVVRFTGQMPATRELLEQQVAQDAEAMAEAYGYSYGGHDTVEILAV